MLWKITKSILFTSILAAVFCCALFPKQILLKGLEWKIARYCSRAFGGTLQIAEAEMKQGSLFFKEGLLKSQDGLYVRFQKAHLKPLFHLKTLTIGGEIVIEGLKIFHLRENSHLRATPAPPRLLGLNLDFETTVNRGELFLGNTQTLEPFSQHLFFDVNYHMTQGVFEGSIAFDWTPKVPQFVSHFRGSKNRPLILSSQFEGHSLPLIANLARYFFQEDIPEGFKNWRLTHGALEGHLAMALSNGSPSRLQGGLQAYDLEAENPFLELAGGVARVGCLVDIDFSKVSQINGEFLLHGGWLSLGQTPSFWQGMWDLQNLQAAICVREGKVESSKLKGSLIGMEGELFMDWRASGKLMEMTFNGDSEEMVRLLPVKMQPGFARAFPKDHFALIASLMRSGEGLELEGKLFLQPENALLHTLSFGCLLGESPLVEEVILPVDLDFSFSRSIDSFLLHLKDQFCLSQKRFGWFKGEKFPLEKFVSPFLFGEESMQLSGCVDFEGTFDEHFLALAYEGENFCLQNPQFCLSVDKIHASGDSQGRAVYYLDLHTWEHVGFLPLRCASYEQKNLNFVLEPANALVYFEKNEISIQNIESQTEGLDLHGNVHLSILPQREVELKIFADHVKGSAADARHFLSHFKDSFVWDLPLEGDVWGEGEVLFFHYLFAPAAHLIEGKVAGEIALHATTPYLSLNDYRSHLVYDCKSQDLTLEGGEGWLSLPSLSSPLKLKTPLFHLYSLQDLLFDLDIRLFEGEHEYLSLTGHANKQMQAVKSIIFSGSCEAFDSPIVIKATQEQQIVTLTECNWNQWKGEGQFTLGQKGVWIQDLALCKNGEDRFLFSGLYDYRLRALDGNLRAFKWNLAHLKGIAGKVEGSVVGSGTLHWSTQKGLSARAYLDYDRLCVGKMALGEGKLLEAVYSSEGGLLVERFATKLESGESLHLNALHYDANLGKMYLDGLQFTIPKRQFATVEAELAPLFPPETLLGWSEACEHMTQGADLEGTLSLEIATDKVWCSAHFKDGIYYFKDKPLSLKDFRLVLDPLKLNIWSQFAHQGKDLSLHVSTTHRSFKEGKLVIADLASQQVDKGKSEGIVVFWEKENHSYIPQKIRGTLPGLKVSLTREEGENEQQTEELLCFDGEVEFNPTEGEYLLAPHLQERFKALGVKGDFWLDGKMMVEKQSLSLLSFQGHLHARGCGLKGVEVQSVDSSVSYRPEACDLIGVSVRDRAGAMEIDRASFSLEEKEWMMRVGNLHLHDLYTARLNINHSAVLKKKALRSLFIRNLKLQDFEGRLTDLTSFKGSGILEFTNFPKKSLLSNLLSLPTEITGRIGLDFTTFVPARGIVDYELKGGKIQLKALREMYSDGKLSRFYLAEGTPAYIDLKGNLNLKVKMKQYNLLMKLTELLTVTVRGTLLHPSYTLTNQMDDETAQ